MADETLRRRGDALTPRRPPSLAPGSLIEGKYRIEGRLGAGGMGAVFLAEHLDIGRKVAIKVLHLWQAKDPQALLRFKMEARAAAQIGHPGIVDVLDFGTIDGAIPFLVMERLPGESLGERLRRGGALSPSEAVAIAAEALEAIAAAHDKGIVHRDLKPDNVFLVEQPARRVKILDFGISKFEETEALSLTATGEVMGTPGYIAPEQARRTRDAGPPADLYAMGAILYAMLAGHPPFVGESYNEVMAQVLTEPHRPLSEVRADVPAALSSAVDSLLAKAPEARPRDARAAIGLLREALAGAARPSKPRRRTRASILVGAAIAGSALAVLGIRSVQAPADTLSAPDLYVRPPAPLLELPLAPAIPPIRTGPDMQGSSEVKPVVPATRTLKKRPEPERTRTAPPPPMGPPDLSLRLPDDPFGLGPAGSTKAP